MFFFFERISLCFPSEERAGQHDMVTAGDLQKLNDDVFKTGNSQSGIVFLDFYKLRSQHRLAKLSLMVQTDLFNVLSKQTKI